MANEYRTAVLADSPIAYWRLGESAGTVAVAEVGPNADYINTPTLGVASLLLADANTSVTFVRSSLEHASANTTMPAGSSVGVTIEAWVKFATLTAATRYAVARWFGGTGAPDTQVYYNVAVGAWRYLYQDATGFRNTHSDAWTPTIGTTYHIVVTHDYAAEQVRFYVNGALLSLEDVSVNGVPVVHAAGSSASVGRVASDYWDGTLDEPAIYNGVLSGTRILAHYNAAITFTGTGAGTQAVATASGTGTAESVVIPPSHGHGPPLNAARVIGPAGDRSIRRPRPVKGTGAGEQAAASAYGHGLHERRRPRYARAGRRMSRWIVGRDAQGRVMDIEIEGTSGVVGSGAEPAARADPATRGQPEIPARRDQSGTKDHPVIKESKETPEPMGPLVRPGPRCPRPSRCAWCNRRTWGHRRQRSGW